MLYLQNIKRRFTGREKIITLTALIVTFVFGGVLALDFATDFATAMTYQNEINVSFKFEPSLSIKLSSPNLLISNLVPGNYSSSNTITVDVTTNNVAGYTLFASVGGVGQTAADNTLVNTQTNTTFTSLSDSDNIILPNFEDNYWGFSTASTINDATTFSGLLYNYERIINSTTNNNGTASTGYAGTNSTKFTIGAKASFDQAAGDYTNVITFTAITNRVPASGIDDFTYMQDFLNLADYEIALVRNSMEVNRQYQLIDSRDNKVYYVARLLDNNIWMTQNLDHDIVTTPGYYTKFNTDISSSWTPSTATYATNNDTWEDLYDAPESYDPGNLCWTDFTFYLVDCSNDKHHHVGNYYNWTAAVAMNDSSDYVVGGSTIKSSICPAGWSLPSYKSNSSYGQLYSDAAFTSGPSGNIHLAPTYFLYGGGWHGTFSDVGIYGAYWTQGVYDEANAYTFLFDFNGNVAPQTNGNRNTGSFVRCLVSLPNTR